MEKIKEFHIRKLSIPLAQKYHLSNTYGICETTNIVVLEIRTENGFIGYGESDPWPEFTGDTQNTVFSVLADVICPNLIGDDSENINMIHKKMDRLIRGNYTAKSAIDVACYDILGKKNNMPIHTLLGGKIRESMDCFWSVGEKTPDKTAKEALKRKNQGYKGCMIKIGKIVEEDIEHTLAVREAVGEDFPLVADANQGWDVETAIRYAKGVKNANLMFFEQPVKYWDVKSMAEIRKHTDILLSADEGVTTIQDAHNYIRNKACDYISVKITKHGGILPTKEICDYAKHNGIKVFFNSMHEEGITQAASLNVAAVTENIVRGIGHAFFSPLRLVDDISDFSEYVNKGNVKIKDKNGLGIQLRYDILKEYTDDEIVIKK